MQTINPCHVFFSTVFLIVFCTFLFLFFCFLKLELLTQLLASNALKFLLLNAVIYLTENLPQSFSHRHITWLTISLKIYIYAGVAGEGLKLRYTDVV